MLWHFHTHVPFFCSSLTLQNLEGVTKKEGSPDPDPHHLWCFQLLMHLPEAVPASENVCRTLFLVATSKVRLSYGFLQYFLLPPFSLVSCCLIVLQGLFCVTYLCIYIYT